MAYRDDRSTLDHELASLRQAMHRLKTNPLDDHAAFEAQRLSIEHETARLQARLRGEANQPPLLRRLKIVSTCDASWDEMQGSQAVRRCALCDKDVFNLEAMTMAEVDAMVRSVDGAACARLRRRRDGKVVTVECQYAEREQRLRRRNAHLAVVVVAVLAGTALFAYRKFGTTVTMGKMDAASAPIGSL